MNIRELQYKQKSEEQSEYCLSWLSHYLMFSPVEHRNFYHQGEHFILCPGPIEDSTARMYMQKYEDECEGEDGPCAISIYVHPGDSPYPAIKVKHVDIPEVAAWVNRFLAEAKQDYPGIELKRETVEVVG